MGAGAVGATERYGYLFKAENRTTTHTAFCKARDAAGLPASYTPHSLRDQYATVMLSNLMPIVDVARWRSQLRGGLTCGGRGLIG